MVPYEADRKCNRCGKTLTRDEWDHACFYIETQSGEQKLTRVLHMNCYLMPNNMEVFPETPTKENPDVPGNNPT